MADNEEKATIKSIPWGDEHDLLLKIAAGCRKDLEIVRRQVKNGIAILWECKQGKYSAHIVTRLEEGDELCVVFFEGSGLNIFGPMILKSAHNQGLSVRAHVKRKGMVRMLEKIGLKQSETVLRG